MIEPGLPGTYGERTEILMHNSIKSLWTFEVALVALTAVNGVIAAALGEYFNGALAVITGICAVGVLAAIVTMKRAQREIAAIRGMPSRDDLPRDEGFHD